MKIGMSCDERSVRVITAVLIFMSAGRIGRQLWSIGVLMREIRGMKFGPQVRGFEIWFHPRLNR